jgi:hypothetical protein
MILESAPRCTIRNENHVKARTGSRIWRDLSHVDYSECGIHVIPSPGLFRVESVSFEPGQDWSHFAIFTIGIILSSTRQCLRPSLFLAEGRSPGPLYLVAFLNRFSFQKPTSINHPIPSISVRKVTCSPTLQYSQNEILVPSRIAFSMTPAS